MALDSLNPSRLRATKSRQAIWAIRPLLLMSVIIGIPVQPGLGQSSSHGESNTTNHELPAPFDFENSIHRVYGTEHGLPSDWIHCVLQTSDGFLWVGTHNGLARFDGVNFNSYKRPNLPANDCRALLESQDGTLWVGTTGGLVKYRHGCPGSFEQIDELAKQSIRAIFEDSSGRIWVGTTRKTWRSNGSTFEPVAEAPSAVWSIIEDGTKIWLGSENGLYEHSQLFRKIPLADNVPKPTKITQLLFEDGELLIGTSRGVMQIENDRVQFLLPKFGNNNVNHIQKIGDDIFVLAHKVFRRNEDGYEVVNQMNPRFVASDDEGGIWICGTRDGKLHYYQPQPFTRMFADTPMRAIFEDQGTIWFGSHYYLNRIENGRTTRFDVPVKIAPAAGIYSICGSRDNSLWLGTQKGLFKWSNDSATPFLRFEGPVTSVMEDSKGTLWFAHGSTTQTLKDGEVTTIDELTGRTNWFFEDNRGVWIGTGSGLFLATDQIRKINDPSFENLNPVFTCHCAIDGTLWLGNENGLVRYRDDRFDVFTSLDGLLADYIQQLQVDNQNNLWVGGRHGYFTVSVDQFDALLAGKINRLACQRVEEDYGTSNLFGFGGSSTACRAQDGTTWIAAGMGVLKIAPLPTRQAPAVDVYIDRVRVSGKTVNADQSIEYLSGTKRLTIDFATPNFSNPSWVRVKYKLEGHDDDWSEAGTERNITYTDLRPGQYAFRVTADNGYGIASEDAVVSFTVKPRWWEIVWLRVVGLLAAVAAGISYFQHRLRVANRVNAALRHEIEEREIAEADSRRLFEQLARVSRATSLGELTTSIAHEIKQPLSAIVSNAQTARFVLGRADPDVKKVRESLEDIASDGNRAASIIDHIHSFVRKQHHPIDQLDLNEVAVEATKLAEPEVRKLGLAIDVDFASDLPLIKGDPVELQQVILNLLRNAAHASDTADSSPRNVRLSTSLNGGSVELAVKDSGKGLKSDQVEQIFEPFFTTKPDGTGMGLAINRKIIEAHGGRIWASVNDDRGATFRFSLPVKADDET